MADARRATAHATSTGHALGETTWLDAHFEACRPEYEAGLRFVGIQPGWRVLDAGCGSGSYLPWLADLVGPTGSVAALDLAEENVAIVRERVATWALPCPVEAQSGDLLSLPYADASCDAVWCANVCQYFTDEDLARLLAEFRRVVRPGGLVAIKDFDMALVRLAPAPVTLFWHYWEAAAPRIPQIQGCLRGPSLRTALHQAGLADTAFHTILIERCAPLAEMDRRYLAGMLGFWAQQWLDLDATGAQTGIAEERAFWHDLARSDVLEAFLDLPDFAYSEGSVVAVGRVPND